MEVKHIMTKEPACCTQDTPLHEVANMMCDFDCGEIPVVENLKNMKPIGAITDRDMVCRSLAKRQNPLVLSAADCMTWPVITVKPDMSVSDCCKLMEAHKIRRILVVDHTGACCGIVAQADIVNHVGYDEMAAVLIGVSQRSGGARSIAA